MRRNYERTLIPVIRSVKHISTCGESTELKHGAHFWAPSTSPQNWGHLSWWGRSKRPHFNLGRCRCVLFGTGSCMAIPSAPTNHILTHWARLSIWKSRPEATRRCVRFMFTICVVSWKSTAAAPHSKTNAFIDCIDHNQAPCCALLSPITPPLVYATAIHLRHISTLYDVFGRFSPVLAYFALHLFRTE